MLDDCDSFPATYATIVCFLFRLLESTGTCPCNSRPSCVLEGQLEGACIGVFLLQGKVSGTRQHVAGPNHNTVVKWQKVM